MNDEAPTSEHIAENGLPAHACDWCGRSLIRAATDECVNPEHRATDATLGLREAGCGCCYVVDMTALELLRARVTPSGKNAEADR